MLSFIKIVIDSLKESLREMYKRSQLQKQYPDCHIHPGVAIDADSKLGRYNVIFRDTKIINSRIGDHTFIQRNSMVFNATIGKYCSIASKVSIGLGNHPTNMVSSHPAFYSNIQPIVKSYSNTAEYSPFQEINIGNDVWIGSNAIILDGIKIGNGAVIGAGSVITRNVPDYAIVLGNPARVFTYRFDEETVKKLLQIKWWDLGEGWFEKNWKLFKDTKKFIEFIENEKNNK
jgi:acetyltransferase-like isoleucine patch superfamily enzyme